MSSPVDEEITETGNEPTKLKRCEFRKKKKVEKRRKRRQLNAEKNKPTTSPTIIEPEGESIAEKQKYEQDKALWEEREVKFKAMELAKKAAKEKQDKAKALSQKRWQDTLLNLPIMPPKFTIDNNKNTTFKTFVKSDQVPAPSRSKKTYRDRFLEQKLARSMK